MSDINNNLNNDLSVARSLGRIEGGISEVKTELRLLRDDHVKLRQEFSSLEAGRLTKLESQFAISQAEMHVKAKNTAIYWSIISSIITGIIIAGILNYLKL